METERGGEGVRVREREGLIKMERDRERGEREIER